MTRLNDLTDLERADRYLATRLGQIERELPPDGKDPAPRETAGLGRWVEYELLTIGLALVRQALRPTSAKRRREE